jgi:nitrite reductase/ring-hydroxylating ferredoxin subunit
MACGLLDAQEMSNTAIARIAAQPELDQVAKPLGEAVVAAYRNAGGVGSAVKNALHGVWLHHPLHPVLTDIPIGAWTTALALDAKAATSGDPSYARAADYALAFGLLGAVGSAVTGLTDWSETDGRAKRVGLVHGLLNVTATALMATAYVLRRRQERRAGQACTLAGISIAMAGAYLGGDLVFGERIGVTHAVTHEPEGFTRVLASSDLPEGTMRRVKSGDMDLLLVRQHGQVCALVHACAHLGGPLSEGELKEGTVVCPWHGSEFRLADGSVVNGPSTHPQPCFHVRERDSQIEVAPIGHSA